MSRPPERAPAPAAGDGLFASLLEALRTRLELVAVELELHLRGLARLVVLAFAVVVCVQLALAFALAAVVVALWDAHRVLALVGGSLAFVLLAALCAAIGLRALSRRPGLLAGTLAQLRADRDRARGPQ